ncbi:hypothetical protein [Lonepinella sp. MS14436]|uniref:hypothetical protein n=1 Tax=Lonepinella sp. MS14436 TaxID=3003619 RepID=UPI0036DCF4C4
MAFFETYFDNGNIQYSSDFRAYSLIKSGQIYNSDFDVFYGGRQKLAMAVVGYPAGKWETYENPILFIRPPRGYLGVITYMTEHYHLRNTMGLDSFTVFKWFNLDYSGSIQYYLFAQARKAVGNYGLQIFDGKGAANDNLMLDSTWGLLSITNAISLPAYTPAVDQNGYYVNNFTLGTQQATCLPRPRTGHIDVGYSCHKLHEGIWVDSSGKLGVGYVPIDSSDSGAGALYREANNTEGSILICETAHLPSNYSI